MTGSDESTQGSSEFPSEASTKSPTDVRFSARGAWAGFVITLPVALGVAGYGVAFGILADQAGLSVAEAALMSATVVAGAAQIVAVELWENPIPVAAIVVTTFVVNLRYSLMGAALRPWFRHLSPRQAYGSLFLMADENWALTLRDLKSGSGRGAFLLGSGIAIWTAWVGATILGAAAGGAIGDPRAYGIDFILAAVFAALAVELWEGRSSVVPWCVALATALVAASLFPGQWYILLGGVAACAVEVARYEE
ncbi:AzlC family ABC transporter permease [Halobacteria archaeon AArc-dxtr1]|nr:AzlC family ABC transporter permease [Halobacteria archaeon AArc-dxtr1]